MKAEKFLYENYGRTDLRGFKYLVYILNNYDNASNMSEIYKRIGKEFNVHWASVERCIRQYSKNSCDKYTKDFVNGLILEYKMKG